MSKGIFETIGGAALIAGGIALEVFSAGTSTALTTFMIKAGAGLVLQPTGTMLDSQEPR